jgi:hypothetical protein
MYSYAQSKPKVERMLLWITWLSFGLAACLILVVFRVGSMRLWDAAVAFAGIGGVFGAAAVAGALPSFPRMARVCLAVLCLLMGALGLMCLWASAANWPAWEGFDLVTNPGQEAQAARQVNLGLVRMDAPGIYIGNTSFKLTSHGPVHVSRVTAYLSLAALARRSGLYAAEVRYLMAAQSAGTDPREDSDQAHIAALLLKARRNAFDSRSRSTTVTPTGP